jgi:hypothetical protein
MGSQSKFHNDPGNLLKDDHPGHLEARVRAVNSRQRYPEQHQPRRGHAEAHPLARADLEVESALGMIASITTPPARTACTTESGTIAIAPM